LNTLFDVKKTIQSLAGDNENGTLTDDYLVPKINFAYKTQILGVMQATGTNLEQLVEIPNATDPNGNNTNQGLTSLAEFQQPGQPLDGLVEPLYLWWKMAGSSEGCYRECYEKKTLPFVPANQVGSLGRVYFTWRGNTLYVTPLNAAIDLLIDGRFNGHTLVKNEDPLAVHPMMEATVTPATMALMSWDGWSFPTLVISPAVAAQSALDNICNLVMMNKQGYSARAGTMGCRRRCGWYWR
jgi:hypothetical protein